MTTRGVRPFFTGAAVVSSIWWAAVRPDSTTLAALGIVYALLAIAWRPHK